MNIDQQKKRERKTMTGLVIGFILFMTLYILINKYYGPGHWSECNRIKIEKNG